MGDKSDKSGDGVEEGEFHQLKGKKEEEGEVPSSPAIADKDKRDKSGDGVEEGEIRSSSKEKRRDRDRDSRNSRDSKERSSRDSASRDRDIGAGLVCPEITGMGETWVPQPPG